MRFSLKKILSLTLCALLLFSLFTACSKPESSDKKDDAETAAPLEEVMRVGNYVVSQKEYDFMLYSQVWSYFSAYYDYISMMGVDFSVSLKEQPCYFDKTISWGDFFMDMAEDSLIDFYCFYNAAIEAGETLSQSGKDQVDAMMLSYSEEAKEMSMSVDEYVAYNYGEGITAQDFATFTSNRLLAAQYCDKVMAAFTYTDEDYEAFYQENRDTFDRVNFRIFTVTEKHLPTDQKPDTDEAADLAVKDYAELFAKDLKTEEEFKKRALAYALEDEKETMSEDSGTLAQKVDASQLADGDMKTWLFSADRVKGDVAVHKTSTSAYTVTMFLSRGRDETPLASMRHLLLAVDEKTEGKTDAEVKPAVDALLAQWESEGRTEESFTALVEKHTEDTASQYTGGLYENFKQGYMDGVIDEWIFAEGRKENDYTIVKGSYGYHILWFLGYGDPVWRSDCFAGMQDRDYEKKAAELLLSYPVSYIENHRDYVGNQTFSDAEK